MRRSKPDDDEVGDVCSGSPWRCLVPMICSGRNFALHPACMCVALCSLVLGCWRTNSLISAVAAKRNPTHSWHAVWWWRSGVTLCFKTWHLECPGLSLDPDSASPAPELRASEVPCVGLNPCAIFRGKGVPEAAQSSQNQVAASPCRTMPAPLCRGRRFHLPRPVVLTLKLRVKQQRLKCQVEHVFQHALWLPGCRMEPAADR